MSIPEPPNPNTPIAAVALVALRRTLQQATQFIRAQDPDAVVYIVQETSLGVYPIHSVDHNHPQVDRFTLVISSIFSGLLLANARPCSSLSSLTQGCQDYGIDKGRHLTQRHSMGLTKDVDCEENEQIDSYDVDLVFEPGVITHFLNQLLEIIPQGDSLTASLNHGLTLIQPNHSRMQSQFTICLMAELAHTLKFQPQEMASFLNCLP
ncbi:MAG: hypothetical protein F6K30_20620, partial [Cyanothece sp. SIO2G6]|nr:hypothetical protein [Cyanothece sp. SIO2G6]